jgi:DNA-binding response OmpR family regulator
MPVMDGLQATRRIKQEMPKTSVMMVTIHENPDYLFEAVKAGAAGYVLKDASGERLLSAVRRTLEGESPLDQEPHRELLVRLARESGDSSGGGSEERSGMPYPGASVATPEARSRKEGEPLASHPVATDPTQRPVCRKGGCDASYPFAFDPNHRVTEMGVQQVLECASYIECYSTHSHGTLIMASQMDS